MVAGLGLAQDQSQLPYRCMQDSYTEAVIPLGRDPQLREMYVTFWHSVRFGRIMEDLDTMAGMRKKSADAGVLRIVELSLKESL